MLFLSVHCSYHWIKRKGKPARREVAPIIVSNHVSYIEPIFYFYELFPTIVASESHDSIPFVGTIIRAMQVFCFHGHILCMQSSNYKKLCYSTILCFFPLFLQVIYVNRFSQSSRKQAVRDIKVKHFYLFAYCYLICILKLSMFFDCWYVNWCSLIFQFSIMLKWKRS